MRLSALYLSVLIGLSVVSGSVYADVATPPPSAPTQPTTTQTNITQVAHRAPAELSLMRNNGLNPNIPLDKQRLTVPAKKQFGSVQNGVATKTNPVRITDPYGNVARTTVHTQTQLPSNTTMSKAGGGLMAAGVVGGALTHQGEGIGSSIARGDYKTAAQKAVEGTMQALKDMGNFVTFGLIKGVESAVDGYNNAKTVADAVENAAQAKAQAAAQAAQANNPNANANVIPDIGQFAANAETGKPAKYPKLVIFSGHLNGSFIVPDWFMATGGSYGDGYIYHKGRPTEMHFFDTSQLKYDERKGFSFKTVQVNAENYHEYKDMIEQAVLNQAPQVPQLTPNDFLLSQAELESVLVNALNQMLENQQENTAAIRDLTNMLWANNLLNADNTQTSVVGTASDNTVVSEPYTPAGSNQAQQTQHVINKNGSITTTYIPRPDLKANSNQAPTRGLLKPKNDKDIDIDIDKNREDDEESSETSSKKDKDDEEICNEENQDRLLCVKAGSDVYKDLSIPSETIDIDFKKDTYFAENGSCPAPVKFSFLGEHEISYEPLCDLARGLRPIVELLGVLTAMGIAYGAVREL